MDPKLLEMLVCPVTKGPLIHDRARSELVSRSARLVLSRDRGRQPDGQLVSTSSRRL